ncbi:hypothetical protein [Clostridium tertium]|uniref:Uncharacterized protein n=1 Tax=Clostridium tertium TaxID=1559 RepID=A0A6N3CEH1_9CLOT
MMHREVVAKKRIPVIATILFTITVILYLAEAVERSKFNEHIIGYAFNGVLVIIALLLIAKEIRSCFVSYKYAVIADKIIINSISSKEEKNLESIKMSDVLYIGGKSSLPKKYLYSVKTKKYLCNRIGAKSYYCICKNGNEIEKIKFQPSEKFINKIIRCGGLKCNLK